MAYWLCITTEENLNVIKEKNIWGAPQRHKNTIAKVKHQEQAKMDRIIQGKAMREIPKED